MNVRTFKLTRVVFSASLPCLLAGCLAVPLGVFTETPYTKEKIASLRTQDADRNFVLKNFGNPVLSRENQRYWFYTNERPMVGVLAGKSGTVLTDDDWLVVEFDQAGKVVFAETRDRSECASNGICFDSHVPTAPLKPLALPHQPNPDECALYLYLDRLPWPLPTGTVRYHIDGKPIGVVDRETYLFLTHPQGKIQISAYDLSTSVDCQGGKTLYIRAVKKIDMSWLTGEDLNPVTQEEGEKNIKTRNPTLLE